MIVVAAIVSSPITPAAEAAAIADHVVVLDVLRDAGASGAKLRFEGVVRCIEAGRGLAALDYLSYDPMAGAELAALARDTAVRHRLHTIVALHSRGRVAVGEVSFILEVTAPHRAETLAAVGEFIDRLKRDVPIWKRPVWAP